MNCICRWVSTILRPNGSIHRHLLRSLNTIFQCHTTFGAKLIILFACALSFNSFATSPTSQPPSQSFTKPKAQLTNPSQPKPKFNSNPDKETISNSRGQGIPPIIRLPIGSPFSSIKTQALSSNLTILPSRLWTCCFVLTTMALRTSPLLTFGTAETTCFLSICCAVCRRTRWTTQTIRSPKEAVLEPLRTWTHSTRAAPWK